MAMLQAPDLHNRVIFPRVMFKENDVIVQTQPHFKPTVLMRARRNEPFLRKHNKVDSSSQTQIIDNGKKDLCHADVHEETMILTSPVVSEPTISSSAPALNHENGPSISSSQQISSTNDALLNSQPTALATAALPAATNVSSAANTALQNSSKMHRRKPNQAEQLQAKQERQRKLIARFARQREKSKQELMRKQYNEQFSSIAVQTEPDLPTVSSPEVDLERHLQTEIAVMKQQIELEAQIKSQYEKQLLQAQYLNEQLFAYMQGNVHKDWQSKTRAKNVSSGSLTSTGSYFNAPARQKGFKSTKKSTKAQGESSLSHDQTINEHLLKLLLEAQQNQANNAADDNNERLLDKADLRSHDISVTQAHTEGFKSTKKSTKAQGESSLSHDQTINEHLLKLLLEAQQNQANNAADDNNERLLDKADLRSHDMAVTQAHTEHDHRRSSKDSHQELEQWLEQQLSEREQTFMEKSSSSSTSTATDMTDIYKLSESDMVALEESEQRALLALIRSRALSSMTPSINNAKTAN